MKIPAFFAAVNPAGAAPSLAPGVKVAPGTHSSLSASAAPQVPLMQPTWFQDHVSWGTHAIAGIGIVAAIALIVLLAVQTTKQEGLSGTIGGKVDSAYRGRPGMDEQLQRVTGFVAGVFVVVFVILSLTGI